MNWPNSPKTPIAPFYSIVLLNLLMLSLTICSSCTGSPFLITWRLLICTSNDWNCSWVNDEGFSAARIVRSSWNTRLTSHCFLFRTNSSQVKTVSTVMLSVNWTVKVWNVQLRSTVLVPLLSFRDGNQLCHIYTVDNDFNANRAALALIPVWGNKG